MNYSNASLIADSITFVQAPSQTKGILVSNTSAAASFTVHLYTPAGATYAATLYAAASRADVFPIKISGAAGNTNVSVHALF